MSASEQRWRNSSRKRGGKAMRRCLSRHGTGGVRRRCGAYADFAWESRRATPARSEKACARAVSPVPVSREILFRSRLIIQRKYRQTIVPTWVEFYWRENRPRPSRNDRNDDALGRCIRHDSGFHDIFYVLIGINVKNNMDTMATNAPHRATIVPLPHRA